MTAAVCWVFVPNMPWNGVTACGSWLKNFLGMLSECPSKDPNPNDRESKAFYALNLAARNFLYDLCNDTNKQIPLQVYFICAASGSETLDPLKSYEDARKYLLSQKENLPQKRVHDIISKQLQCLDLLRVLRENVDNVILYLDISKPFSFTDIFGAKHEINPKEMYQEFLRHYSYDTMMLYPQPLSVEGE